MKTSYAIAIVTLGCAHAFVMPPAARTASVRPQTARAAEKAIINTIEFEKTSPKVR